MSDDKPTLIYLDDLAGLRRGMRIANARTGVVVRIVGIRRKAGAVSVRPCYASETLSGRSYPG